MKPKELKAEIDRLELSEKLLLVEDIWDSIAANNAELPLPEWQKKELDRRYAKYQQGNLDLHDWKAVHDELRDKYNRLAACLPLVLSNGTNFSSDSRSTRDGI